MTTYFLLPLSQYRVRRRRPIRRVTTVILEFSILRSMENPGPYLDSIPPYPVTDAIIVRFLEGLLAYWARGVS